MPKTYPCCELVDGQPCAALAPREGGQCETHAKGYKKHPSKGALTLRCDNCRKIIGPGFWYRVVNGQNRHMRDCQPAPPTRRAKR